MKLLPSAVVYMWFNERHTAESSICVPPSPWFTACAWGFFEVLQASLHNSKPDLERRNAQGETSLWVASRYGHLDIAKALIENDVDIDSTDQYGYTALHASIIYKKRDITRLLLGNNASCTKRIGDLNGDEHDTLRIDRYDGLDALHLAAYDGSEEIMRLLLEKKVDINARNSTQGETALHIAAGQNHAEQVRLLIEYGACIDLESGQGGTAIGQAAILGHVDIVRILADELHSNEDSKWWVKVARVMRAIKLSDELQVQQLLDDDENDDYSGKQPLLSKWPLVFKALQSAVITGCQKIVTILLSKGADANMPDDYGTTPLHLATHHRKYGVQKLLLDHGVNIEAANCRGWRALHYAAQNENALDMIQSLVEKGANIEAEGEEGRRALHYAARNRRYHETVQLLLKRGADIEAEDDNGWRALHYAARANNLSEVQFLLEKGANVDSEDISGTTALDLAVYRVSVGVTRLLLEKGAIPRRVYVKYSEPKYPRRGVKERWGAIQKMISAWSESDSDYR
jgi:serine/threonine-protein phosphatase 6 regulatory ankyrin repeat subunit B